MKPSNLAMGTRENNFNNSRFVGAPQALWPGGREEDGANPSPNLVRTCCVLVRGRRDARDGVHGERKAHPGAQPAQAAGKRSGAPWSVRLVLLLAPSGLPASRTALRGLHMPLTWQRAAWWWWWRCVAVQVAGTPVEKLKRDNQLLTAQVRRCSTCAWRLPHPRCPRPAARTRSMHAGGGGVCVCTAQGAQHQQVQGGHGQGAGLGQAGEWFAHR